MEQKYEAILVYNEGSFLRFSFYKRVKQSEKPAGIKIGES
jgi:hypothetical protein